MLDVLVDNLEVKPRHTFKLKTDAFPREERKREDSSLLPTHVPPNSPLKPCLIDTLGVNKQDAFTGGTERVKNKAFSGLIHQHIRH